MAPRAHRTTAFAARFAALYRSRTAFAAARGLAGAGFFATRLLDRPRRPAAPFRSSAGGLAWPGGLFHRFSGRGPASRQQSVDGGGDLIDWRHAIHRLELSFGVVIAGKRRGLRPVGGEPALEDLRIVVGAQLLAARGHLSHALLDAGEQHVFVDFELD